MGNVEKLDIIKAYFGYAAFRNGQERIIDCLLGGRDVLCVMPAGAGKSLCYQVSALLGEGITLVVSPLNALMKDQVAALIQSGIPAGFLNSSLSQKQIELALRRAAAGWYKLLYLSPERLQDPAFLDFCRRSRLPIERIAVDEAQCLSQWGPAFRPSYLKIADFVEKLPRRPVVGAFTDTATKEVREDIIRMLRLEDPLVLAAGFDRENLFWAVERPADKMAALRRLLEREKGLCGIVYCATRGTVERVHQALLDWGLPAAKYHAGMTAAERRHSQEDFIFDRRTLMVATSAFGMGMDKSNLSFVIHYNMPRDLETYYQEAGRAGQDGQPARCTLLFNPTDQRMARQLIQRGPAQTQQRDSARLEQMIGYCKSRGCLRAYLLRYFGEAAPGACGRCSNCKARLRDRDATREGRLVLECVRQTHQRFGVRMILHILRGVETGEIKRLGFHRLEVFGSLADQSEQRLRSVLRSLGTAGYLSITDGMYPTLQLTPRSQELLEGDARLTAPAPPDVGRPVRHAMSYTLVDADLALFDRLKELRRRLAKEAGLPAYRIFTDASLLDMSRRRPTTTAEFLEIIGMDDGKCRSYGPAFLTEIRAGADRRGNPPSNHRGPER